MIPSNKWTDVFAQLIGEVKQNGDLWPARLPAIQVLQDRRYNVSERLIGLGLLCRELEGLGTDRREADVLGIVERFARLAASGALKHPASYDERHDRLQMAMLTALLISGYHGSLLPRQRQLLDEFLAGIQYVDKMPVAELAARVRSLREHYWASFERSYSYILENYLVHEAYRIGLPLRPGPFDSYARLVLTFALFVFQLIGLSGIHHEITPELAVRVAQCEARKVQHGGDTVQRMADWLRANESYNLATLVILAH